MKANSFFMWFIIIILCFFILIVAKDFMIPLVLAFFIWYLINVLSGAFHNISIRGHHPPKVFAFSLSILAILSISVFIVHLITTNISQVVKAAPAYQQNLEKFITQGFELLNLPETPDISQFSKDINFTKIISQIASGLTSFVGDAGLVAIYLFFLFLEQKFLRKKLIGLVRDEKHRKDVLEIINRVDGDIRKYVGIKTFVSLATGLLGYSVLKIVGVHFAEFWGVLLFLLNYIPTIGSLVATMLPALMALVQFGQVSTMLYVLGGVQLVQLVMANFVEPRLMGKSLNLSPLVIILSLVIWGTIWGIPGMFLCVPLTSIIMIVFSHFPKTRPVAVLLSREGNVEKE